MLWATLEAHDSNRPILSRLDSRFRIAGSVPLRSGTSAIASCHLWFDQPRSLSASLQRGHTCEPPAGRMQAASCLAATKESTRRKARTQPSKGYEQGGQTRRIIPTNQRDSVRWDVGLPLKKNRHPKKFARRQEEYCFNGPISKERLPQFGATSLSSRWRTSWVPSGTQIIDRRERYSLSSLPGTRWGQKNHWARCSKPNSREPYLARLRGEAIGYVERLLKWCRDILTWLGCKRGSYSAKGRVYPLSSKYLLSAFYDTPLLRTLLRTPVPTEALTRALLRTLPRSTSFKELSKIPSKKRVVAWPLGVHPYGKVSTRLEASLGGHTWQLSGMSLLQLSTPTSPLTILDGQNRQSPLASGQRTQATLTDHSAVSMWNECSTNERQSHDSNRSATKRKVSKDQCLSSKERYDRQQTSVIRIAAITLASGAAIIARFRPSKDWSKQATRGNGAQCREDLGVRFWTEEGILVTSELHITNPLTLQTRRLAFVLLWKDSCFLKLKVFDRSQHDFHLF